MTEKQPKQPKKPKETSRRKLRDVVAFLAGAVLAGGISYLIYTRGHRIGPYEANTQRDQQTATQATQPWAQRLELPGVPNFHKVSDNLYRGAQPTAEGMAELKKLGIKTIVNLRAAHSDRDKIGDTGLSYEHIPMAPWSEPDDEDVARFLRIAVDERSGPVFVHCRHGADRTGTMCAAYRIAVQGWAKQEAADEMTLGGFGFHRVWDDLVDYVRKMDVEKVRRLARLDD